MVTILLNHNLALPGCPTDDPCLLQLNKMFLLLLLSLLTTDSLTYGHSHLHCYQKYQLQTEHINITKRKADWCSGISLDSGGVLQHTTAEWNGHTILNTYNKGTSGTEKLKHSSFLLHFLLHLMMANFSRNMSWTILSDEVLWSFRPYKLW
jgi:hypothetical protein